MIDAASFAAVFDVQGATTIMSVSPLGPIGSAAEIVVITSFPVIFRSFSRFSSAVPKRVDTDEAFSDIIGIRSAPYSVRISACAKQLPKVQNEPVIANPIRSPLSASLNVITPLIYHSFYSGADYFSCGHGRGLSG